MTFLKVSVRASNRMANGPGRSAITSAASRHPDRVTVCDNGAGGRNQGSFLLQVPAPTLAASHSRLCERALLWSLFSFSLPKIQANACGPSAHLQRGRVLGRTLVSALLNERRSALWLWAIPLRFLRGFCRMKADNDFALSEKMHPPLLGSDADANHFAV